MHKYGSVALIKIYPLRHGKSFPPSLLPFLFNWWMKKVGNRWRYVDDLYDLYLLCYANSQMHMYLIASFIKIITKRVAVVYGFKLARMVSCWDLYAILGLWFTNTVGAKITNYKYVA